MMVSAKRKGSPSFKTINFPLAGRMIIINHYEDGDGDDDDGFYDDDMCDYN